MGCGEHVDGCMVCDNPVYLPWELWELMHGVTWAKDKRCRGMQARGPDLTHLMGRETIASGAPPNTPENLWLWIQNPNALKPGSGMPAMGLTDLELLVHNLSRISAKLPRIQPISNSPPTGVEVGLIRLSVVS
jgi:hypothetical protein